MNISKESSNTPTTIWNCIFGNGKWEDYFTGKKVNVKYKSDEHCMKIDGTSGAMLDETNNKNVTNCVLVDNLKMPTCNVYDEYLNSFRHGRNSKLGEKVCKRMSNSNKESHKRFDYDKGNNDHKIKYPEQNNGGLQKYRSDVVSNDETNIRDGVCNSKGCVDDEKLCLVNYMYCYREQKSATTSIGKKNTTENADLEVKPSDPIEFDGSVSEKSVDVEKNSSKISTRPKGGGKREIGVKLEMMWTFPDCRKRDKKPRCCCAEKNIPVDQDDDDTNRADLSGTDDKESRPEKGAGTRTMKPECPCPKGSDFAADVKKIEKEIEKMADKMKTMESKVIDCCDRALDKHKNESGNAWKKPIEDGVENWTEKGAKPPVENGGIKNIAIDEGKPLIEDDMTKRIDETEEEKIQSDSKLTAPKTGDDKYVIMRSTSHPSVICIRPPKNEQFNSCEDHCSRDCVRIYREKNLFCVHDTCLTEDEDDTVDLVEIICDSIYNVLFNKQKENQHQNKPSSRRGSKTCLSYHDFEDGNDDDDDKNRAPEDRDVPTKREKNHYGNNVDGNTLRASSRKDINCCKC